MHIEALRKLAAREEIDYQFLISALSNYTHPRDKITQWLKRGDLIRIKKGLYIFGPTIATEPYSLEILANLIYGPSAISLSYALSLYGFIPERVSTITSITPKRNKLFLTPVGDFQYTYLNPVKYPIDIELNVKSPHHPFLIASPEKALCDQIILIDKSLQFKHIDDMHHYLLDDMRIDEAALKSLKLNHLLKIKTLYQDKKLDLLITFIKKWKS